MNRIVLLSVLVVGVLAHRASAAVVMKRVHSDIAGVDFVISCAPGPAASDYTAETASGIPPTDAYAVARGANHGLVRMMERGGRRRLHYAIPRRLIGGVVRVRYDMTVLDRADLVFIPSGLILIHTFTTNAGFFTESDVYRLPYRRNGSVDQTPLDGDQALSRLLGLGLRFYQPRTGVCA